MREHAAATLGSDHDGNAESDRAMLQHAGTMSALRLHVDFGKVRSVRQIWAKGVAMSGLISRFDHHNGK